jgi:hypothetical protein
MTGPDDTVAYLSALYADARPSGLVELRWRTSAGMAQAFHPVHAVPAIAEELVRLGAQTDIYVGVLPRWRAAGSVGDVDAGARVAWADCDSLQAAAALEGFTPAPSLLVASGTPGHLHAYWLLGRPVTIAALGAINRRLALALEADPACADAARILRAPGTLNHKARPPAAVRLERLDAGVRFSPAALTAGLPQGQSVPEQGSRRDGRRPPDPLRAVEPAVYVRVLTGQAVPASRKVRCPLHDDRRPSLHVYRDPDRGWFCFGCRRGGSIYDLAGLLWGIEPRGRGFLVLRRRLSTTLAAAA